MADNNITIAAKTIPWYGASAVELWLYATKPWVTAAGTPISASSPYDLPTSQLPLMKFSCSVDTGAHTLTVSSGTVTSTENAQVNPDVTLIAVFVDTSKNRAIVGYSVFGGDARPFTVPASPATTSWDEIAVHNAGGLAPTVPHDAHVTGNLTVDGNLTLAGNFVPPIVKSFNGRTGLVALQSSDLNGLNGAGLSGIGTGTGGVINTGSTTIGADSDADDVGSVVLQTKTLTRFQIENDGFISQPGPLSGTNLSAVITAIGSAQKTLRIATAQSLSANLTIPANVTLEFTDTGSISIASTKTLTINGPILAPDRQIFSGSGAVSLAGSSSNQAVRAEWFGVKGDGVTDDTTALQAAINALGVSGGIIRTNGTVVLNPALLAFPALTNTLTFEVYGAWKPSTTLVLPNRANWVGLGGATNLQFQNAGPTAGIIPPSGNIPTLIVRGSNDHLIKNLAISGNSGIGIYIDGASALGALVRLDNVAVNAAVVATAQPLQIDGAFWVWAEHCAFLSNSTALHSIRITSSSSAFSTAGLIYVTDTIISGKGVKIDSQVTASIQGNVFFRNCHYESGNGALLTLDSTNGDISHVTLDQFNISDAVSVPAVIDASGGRAIRNITVRDSTYAPVPLVSGQSIQGLYVNGENIYGYPAGWSPGQNQRDWSAVINGVFQGGWSGAGAAMGPSVVPYTSLDVSQDVSTWGALAGSATVTTGILAPDGTATAAKLTSGVGENAKTVYRQTLSVAVGDFVIAGVWMRSEDATVPPYTGSIFSFNPGSVIFDGGSNVLGLSQNHSRIFGTSWMSLVVMGKVTTAPVGSAEYILSLKVDDSHPTSFWMPFLIRIPAGTMDEREVIRLKRYLSNVQANAPTGAVAMFAHQKLYFGADTNLYRSAADQLKTDDKLIAVAGLGVGNAASATTPGTVVKKVEIFDASGVSLGFIPVYSSIT